MDILIDRKTSIEDVKKINIKLNDTTNFRIEVRNGELVITKIGFDTHAITLQPKVSNQITIK